MFLVLCTCPKLREKKKKPKTLQANSGNFLLIHDKKREREHRVNSPVCDIDGENFDRWLSRVYVFEGSLTTHEISRKFKIKWSY